MKIDRLDLFRREVDLDLACGALADVELQVTSDDGGHPVVVALEDERLSVLLGRVRAAGGYANVFVRGEHRTRAASFIDSVCAIPSPGDRLVGDEAPGATATVGTFLDYVERHPNGVTVSEAVGQPACARDARDVDLSFSAGTV